MHNRWRILAVLFTVRLTMAFQFQTVAAVAPLLKTQFGVGIAEIGFLIGLYFTPGVVLALPGGAIGKWLGDKRTTILALVLMLAGSLAMAFGENWGWQIAGRLVGGAGGVLLNVQLSKMVTDWFAGKEIATAMAIFVNSWPAGIALSLLTLPSIGTSYGVQVVDLFVVALAAIGIVLILFYRSPPNEIATAASSARLDPRTIMAVLVAGVIWGLYNVGFATIVSFGPTLLVERGWSIAQAGSAISIGLGLSVFSIPLGGFIADRSKRPQAVLVLGALALAVLLLCFAHTGAVILSVIAMGLVGGQPAGPMMSLPARVLLPATRTVGMGLFYTLYYGTMMIGPIIGGAAAKWTGSAVAAFDFGAIVVLVCPVLLLVFNAIAATRLKAVEVAA
ncbi:MAG TPA: MFS transporter [Bradyrhizobium sp.]|uniref:MFS transporter n=1 Tax=Bradyrhizobium sp. TaxID=376 RepID=UPI002C8DF1C9|nr:MFS transporter [Bradyrhizobium sp.]HLZ05610.1 MFS transporter [Bradyrhizobium sp.]